MFWGGTKSQSDVAKQQALQELRSKLDATDVHKQLLAGQEPGVSAAGLDDLTLTRWLAAEEYNVAKAFQRLCNHAPWRAKNFPAGRIPEKDIKSELEGRKSFLQGVDKQGRAVSLILASKHSRSKRDIEETKRLICYCLDASIDRCDLAKNPTGKVVAIFDLRGLHMDAMDTSALSAVFDLMQNHYPERLGMLWMYEASFLFNSIWKVVSPFIDANTKAKIKFIGKDGQPELLSVIGPTVLPKDVGGQADLVPTQDAVARMGQDRSQTQSSQLANSQEQTLPRPLAGSRQEAQGNGHPLREPAVLADMGNSRAEGAAEAPMPRLPEHLNSTAAVPARQPVLPNTATSAASVHGSEDQAAHVHQVEGDMSSPINGTESNHSSGHKTGQRVIGAIGRAKERISNPMRTS